MEQKISKYSTATIVSLLCLIFSLPLQAQQQRAGARPAVKQKAKEEIKADTIPFYNGTYVGVDLFGLGSKLLGGDFLSSEVNVRVNLKKKFIPTVEIGFGQTDTRKVIPVSIIKVPLLIFALGLTIMLLKNICM